MNFRAGIIMLAFVMKKTITIETEGLFQMDIRGAFFGDVSIKARYLARVKVHVAADAIIQGAGWEGGKGCAIGCTFEDYDHSKYESELNVPTAVARLEDVIFEGLPNSEAQKLPVGWLEAIPVGSDQSLTHWKFLHWLLLDLAEKPYAQNGKQVVLNAAHVIEPATHGDTIDEAAARAADVVDAASTARAAAEAADAAAAVAADRAWHVGIAGDAAKAEYRRYRDKMLELMKAAPVAAKQKGV